MEISVKYLKWNVGATLWLCSIIRNNLTGSHNRRSSVPSGPQELVNHWSHFLMTQITERSQKPAHRIYRCHPQLPVVIKLGSHLPTTGIRWAAVWPKVQSRCSQYHSQGRNKGEITEQQESGACSWGAGLVWVCGLGFPANRVALRDGLALGSECRIAWVTPVVGLPTPRLLWLSSDNLPERLLSLSQVSGEGLNLLPRPNCTFLHSAFLVLFRPPSAKATGTVHHLYHRYLPRRENLFLIFVIVCVYVCAYIWGGVFMCLCLCICVCLCVSVSMVYVSVCACLYVCVLH